MIRKVCVFTGSRAEYGLLQPLMKGLKEDNAIQLQLLVSGMHLSPEFGLTYEQINADGYEIDEKVEMLLSADTDTAIIKSAGLGMIGYADAFARLMPDMVVILGDRFEAFAAATSAYLMKIPIAHLHGGELTEGASDDALRHAITKMSYYHFTSTEIYRQRVIQLGESPSRVFNIGAIGLDNIRNLKLLSLAELESSLGIKLSERVFLVTYHPVTLENYTAAGQMEHLLGALNQFPEYQVIFTLPNADADGRIISSMIREYASETSDRISVFTSLGQLRYLSLIQFVTAVVGNSSSGIIEVPSMGKPTLNIGDRQAGRIRAKTVTDCEGDLVSIANALRKITDPVHLEWCQEQPNPYGNGTAADQILSIIRSLKKPESIKKKFYDLNTSND